METRAVNLALSALILGNLLASLSDVAVKVLDGSASPFQYIFLRQLVSALIIAPLYLKLKTEETPVLNWKITVIRAHLIIIGAGCMVIAITYLPLATANAVFYAAPLLMLPFSLWILKERPGKEKVIATFVGFAGVLIVLRPSQFHWAGIFALGTATTLALFHILVRKLPKEQSVSHTLFWTSLFSLPVSGLLAVFNWKPLDLMSVGWILTSSLCVLAYNGLAVYAYKKVQADQVALAEYSGLIFVTLFGVWWFDEIPDLLTAAGIMLIVIPILPYRSWRKSILKLRRQP